jgi:transposase-like protein
MSYKLFFVRYGFSYRDLEETMEERSIKVDQSTLNCWDIDYSPLISTEAKKANMSMRNPSE